ncbi:MAG TPA: hypothetical protein VGL47_43900 [Amycolatopsis sp.]|uniref:Uncharacterized protein n=1 Tax=Amycolatopsis nalaikhensis TaxID=715472 RepID=A0ABY8XLI8_9PSEU|nr:hypothetical protein [Amycolatopsis sp. 2-2]WIV56442.1 hypothetical protein QP939_47910 [Amycolatopsis sp. 2-2]
MTRRARRRRDRVTVDELLRQAGARPRKPGSRSAEGAARRGPEAEPRGAAGRVALASAVLVVLGGLVLALATRPDPVPGSTQFPQLQPATGVPSSSAVAAPPTRTTTPSPVVMHARRTPTPTPTVTVELPPPSTTVPPSTWDPPWNCYPYYHCGYRR